MSDYREEKHFPRHHGKHGQHSRIRWRRHCRQSPARVRSWLQDRGSLTARLRQRLGREFTLQRLRQYRRRASAEECRALKCTPGTRVLIREVILGAQAPWIFAWTLLPLERSAQACRLQRLGRRPLGEILFKEQNTDRSPLQYSRWRHGGKTGWQRRSCFRWHNYRILVCERFIAQDLVSTPLRSRKAARDRLQE